MEARIAAFRPVVGRGSGRRHGKGTGSGRSSQASSPNSQSPLGGTSPTTPSSTGPSGGYYWGAAVGTQFTGSLAPWDMTALSDFENADAGAKSASVLPWGFQFYAPYCDGYCTFVESLYQATRAAGMIPWVNWESSSSTGTQGFTDAEIASGSQDAYITQFAQAAKAWGHPFFLRFDWEMNAGWFPWGVGANGNTAADFVAMWRHVHDIFTQVGATNVSWVWCPNVDPNKQFAPLASLYPGDAYVDWTCLDGYNGDNPWASFQDLFQSSYSAITRSIAPDQAAVRRRDGEHRGRRLQGRVDRWDVQLAEDRLPAGSRADLVRRILVRPGKRIGLAAGELRLGAGSFQSRDCRVGVRGQQLLEYRRQSDRDPVLGLLEGAW